ncbi:HAMP domain-containing sensor histidine kinase [Ruminococcus sp.]|uniref:sensor histidine kinase n=1 Tax=Ruminococcus sp. TaxID=41978 RepID=UPI001B55EEE6|nr:HAMP domain-containing sensor histidine kinase [Ruminococcus sp.]MBP5431252.1 HAMP domain-containing histidine kinase [Ruminococcus sp.]
MKAYVKWTAIVLLLFLAAAFAFNRSGISMTQKKKQARNIVTQRITHEIEVYLAENNDTDDRNVEASVFFSRKEEWDSLYGKDSSPDTVQIYLLGEGTDLPMQGGYDVQIQKLYNGTDLAGVVEYHFSSSVYDEFVTVMNVCLSVCGLFLVGTLLLLYKRVIVPFNRLSDYPERLSKGQITEKLPVTKDRFFGRYTWAMNMLSDKLEQDRQTLRRFTIERERFVTALVHGIKTPTSNIKLLCEAISTGLYAPDGSANEKDAELAAMIEKNTDDIEEIINRVMNESASVIYDYDPEAKPFYRNELIRFLREEFANRLTVKRIPFHIVSDGNPIIKSDIDGVCRILRQLMDNAIKYGDGTGITVTFTKQDEGHFITVSNQGHPLPESEVHFVFNSLWRGSNADGINGNGIGLYEAKLIAKKLGGDIRMRTEAQETFVTLFLAD